MFSQLDKYKVFIISLFGASVIIAIGAFSFIYVNRAQYNFETKKLEVSFMDVGQGDAELIDSGEGQYILIDGGPDKSILRELKKQLPWWENTIDAVVLTHSHDDHISGVIEVLTTYKVGKIYVANNIKTNDLFLELVKLANKLEVPLIRLGRDYEIGFGQNRLLLTISTSTLRGEGEIENEQAIVAILITPNQNNIIFMSDVGAAREKYLLASQPDLRASIVKIGHHGSDKSTSEYFLDHIGATRAVISVGKGNKYHHPSPRTLKRLERFKQAVYRTDLVGTITFQYSQAGWSLD